nr:hypothetical protein BACY1_20740 [Tenacibaculum mesophilum]
MQNNTTPQNYSYTKIGEYNQSVKNFLEEHPITEIVAHAIKNFKAEAYRKRYSELQYNKAVEDFNSTHGYYIPKKGKETVKKYYHYINYPYMDRDAVNITMDNYRAYRDKYNAKTKEYNKEINNFNKEVIQTKDKNILAKIEAFKKENQGLFTKEYNEKVDSFNSCLGANYVRKKRLQKLYNNLNDILNVFVGFYVKQLKIRNYKLMNSKRPTTAHKSAFPKLKINYTNTAEHKQNGNKRLETTPRSLQNAVKRLIEAGVIENYVFFDRNRPVFFNISFKILHVLDGNPPKSQHTDNPSLNPSKTKKFRILNHTTRTLSKENKIDDCENITDHNKSGSMLEDNESNNGCLADSYKNTNQVEDKKNTAPSRADIKKLLPDFMKSTKKRPQHNSKLLAKVEKTMLKQADFSKMLSQGKFDSYKGIRYDQIQNIIQYSGLFLDELKLFLVHDFVKSSAKIWKNHNVLEGSWYNAISMLQNQLFAGITQKDDLIPKLKEYRWKLEYARKWFVHSRINALYPSLYFDVTRTHKKEVGFYGLHQAWQKHLEKKSKQEAAKKKLKRKSNERKREIIKIETNEKEQRYSTKLNKKLNEYFEGKITQQQLFEYVRKNLPKKYQIQLQALSARATKNKA